MAIEGFVASNDEHYFDPDEELNATRSNNDMECKTIHLVEARVGGKKYLDSLISEHSRSFPCSKLLQVERSYHKLFRICVAHISATKKFDIQTCMLHG